MKPPSISQVSSAAASYKPSTLEKVARALAVQAGCNPDDPAFVSYPSGEAFGLCWRDKFLEPARAALHALRQVDDETVEAMARDHGWRGLNRTRDTANLAGRGFKSIVQAILTEGGEG